MTILAPIFFLKILAIPRHLIKDEFGTVKNADYISLNESIRNTDWSFLRHEDINTAVLNFTNTFLDLVKSNIPYKFVTVRPRDRPWYNSEIRKTSRKRDRYKHTATISGKLSDWSRYKHIRNKVNNMKKQAKEIFFNNIEFTLNDICSSNPRQYWKIVKMLVKDNSSKCDIIPPLLNENDTYFFTDIEKANSLNNYFSSISNIDDSQARLPPFHRKTEKKLNNFTFTEQDIIDILSNLNVNKANGPDEISHRMLKETVKTICVPLTIIFNRSIQENNFPGLWKNSNVMPLFKKGDKNIASNYRPISLISCVGESHGTRRLSIFFITTYIQMTLLTKISQVFFLV